MNATIITFFGDECHIHRQPAARERSQAPEHGLPGVLGVAVLGSLVSVPAAFIGGLRAGLVIAGCAFLAGAALAGTGLARA